MLSRERVTRALEFRRPDRPPRDLWWLPAVEMRQKADLRSILEEYTFDIETPPFTPGASERQKGQPTLTVPGSHPPISLPRAGERYMDEWGSVWHIAEDGVIGEVKEPALGDLAALAWYAPPWDYLDTTDLSGVDEHCAKSDKFVLSDICARPFERLQFIRGTEKFFIDLAYGTKEIYTLRDMVHEYNLRYLDRWLATDVDAVFLMDDWGAKNSLLISPETWRSFLKPLYREYCERAHRRNKFVFFHSDGCIEAVFGDLVEIGVDAVNSQLFAMDLEALGEKYRGKITFWGEISRFILSLETPARVREAVGRVKRALYDERGGAIAQCEWGKDNDPANIRAVFEAWEK
jgi:uroporphyrinogen decarboxylase